MRSVRFSIAGLMGVVLITAIGLAALRSPSHTWAGVLLLATLAALCIAVIGAFCRTGAERGGWIGFAVFGWAYLGAAFDPYEFWPKLPTQSLLEWLAPRVGGPTGPFADFGGVGGAGGMGSVMRNVGGFGGGFGGTAAVIVPEPFFQIGHCLFALLAASLGALLGNRLFGAAVQDRPETNISRLDGCCSGGIATPEAVGPATGVPDVEPGACRFDRNRWRDFPTGALGRLDFPLHLVPDRPRCAGALVGRPRRREAWLGAALFGAGFMLLPFGRFAGDAWPRPPTVEFLNELRPWLPAVANGLRADPASVTAANARIHQALNQTVPMHFLEETPLEDVLKAIKKATIGPDGNGIPIYVDPLGVVESERPKTSPIRNLDFEGVPIRTSLRLCLEQLGLAYSIKDGLLLITSAELNDESMRSAANDAYQVVGHCVLALIAAGIGGLAAPFVCGLARKPAQ